MIYSTKETKEADTVFSISVGIRFIFTIIFLVLVLTYYDGYSLSLLILQLFTFISSSIMLIAEVMKTKEEKKVDENTDAEKGTKLVEIKE